jgi:signal-transduction protein with cAMP-binding, CBS, and nucleotidyltransferase domain
LILLNHQSLQWILVVVLSETLLVRDIMTSPVKAVREDTVLHEVIATLSNFDINALVVVEGDKPVGIVTAKDVLTRAYEQGMPVSTVKAGLVASSPVTTIEEEASVQEAADLMRKKHVKHLPVTRQNCLVGMLSDTDIIFAMPKMMNTMEEVCRPNRQAASTVKSAVGLPTSE